MNINNINDYNKNFTALNPAGKTTPMLQLTKQVLPEINVTPKDSYNISFAAQERARAHAHEASLVKLSAQVNQKIKAHAEHFKA
ncbi:hypothetical protein [Periweissella fabalis]|uniref:Uncharacterized protein n=1 Tax=Periweissella fabalis TaxID=1070421 RepID=A0A7X6S2E7_9LACO|nr:hypothetical protein [Periweissella fabalis]MCM0599956.1 hypothetical protein [Periweissella fabalis]NKZ23989.1 hypothetical protein [Periweissella fabalis]